MVPSISFAHSSAGGPESDTMDGTVPVSEGVDITERRETSRMLLFSLRSKNDVYSDVSGLSYVSTLLHDFRPRVMDRLCFGVSPSVSPLPPAPGASAPLCCP